MGRKKSANVEEKRKAVKVRPIERKHAGKVVEPYRIMESVIKDHHTGEADGVQRNLDQAKIILLWHKGWNPDVDKVVTLAKIKSASEVDRAIGSAFGDQYDFVMQLNEAAWPGLSDAKKRQIIDHELCHAAPDLDRDGHQKLDAKERLCWRTRKHPIQEFPEIIERYGVEECLGLNDQALKAVDDADRPLLKAAEQAAQGSGKRGSVPKRIRLTADCDGLGEAGSEWDVALDGDQLWAKTAAGSVYSLTNVAYEVLECEVIDWRRLPMTELKLTDSVLQKMGDKDVLTLGDFSAFQARHGEHWAKDLGLRGSQGASVLTAYDAFWAKHPEHCQTETPDAA